MHDLIASKSNNNGIKIVHGRYVFRLVEQISVMIRKAYYIIFLPQASPTLSLSSLAWLLLEVEGQLSENQMISRHKFQILEIDMIVMIVVVICIVIIVIIIIVDITIFIPRTGHCQNHQTVFLIMNRLLKWKFYK